MCSVSEMFCPNILSMFQLLVILYLFINVTAASDVAADTAFHRHSAFQKINAVKC